MPRPADMTGIGVSREAAEAFDVAMREHAVIKQEGASRLLLWFAKLPPPLRLAIIAGLEEDYLALFCQAVCEPLRKRKRKTG